MITGEWTCTCTVVNDGGVRFCESCGAEHTRTAMHGEPATVAPNVPTGPSAYREVVTRERPASSPDDPCPEPGCTKSVAEHIAEAKAISGSPAWTQRFGSTRG